MHDDRFGSHVLNHARAWVFFNSHGMCLNLAWHGTAEADLTEEERRLNYPETLRIDELEGNVMAGFEDAFFDQGGRVGGW
jgi:alpha 1,2-mannosyltransferase